MTKYPSPPLSPVLAAPMDRSMLHGAPVRGGLPRPQPTSATVPSGLSASRFDQGARSNVAAQPTTGGTHMVLKKKAVKIATCPRPPPASSPAINSFLSKNKNFDLTC